MSAVTLVLLLIILSGRFIRYLADAAAGNIAADVLFSILGYRMPEFLSQILPLGLFLGILLSYGRLYLDSEITVLRACGMTTRRLLVYTLIPAGAVALLVAFLSISGAPWGAAKTDEILRAQDARTEFDALNPGRFHEINAGELVIYGETLSSDRKVLRNVFASEVEIGVAPQQRRPMLTMAESASQYIDARSGSLFLSLQNGYLFEGTPGEPDYRVVKYERADFKVPKAKQSTRQAKIEAKSTASLLGSSQLEDIAELQWRLSLPLLVPVVALIAVPLSRVNPRQGRFLRLLPAIFLYMAYLFILSTLKTSIEDGSLPPLLGMWWVHLLFLGIALALIGNWHHRLAWFGRGKG